MLKRYFRAIDAGVSGSPNTFFDANSSESDSASFDQHVANLEGVAGATLTLQVTTYNNTNPIGRVLINGNQVFLNSTFPITLNGSGLGSFLFRVEGNAGAGGTIVRAIITIVGMTSGNPGSPISNQNSKVF